MISIIIPTLDEEKAIGDTLKYLKPLSLPHEIIVADGGSGDRTVAIASELADKVVVLKGPRPLGAISYGRNGGAKAAKGDFFVFLDADCRIFNLESFFKEVLSEFEKDKDLVGLLPNLRILPEVETAVDKLFFHLMNYFIRFKNNFLHQGDAGGGECQIVRREAFWRIKGYREDLVTREDRDLFHRLSKIGRTKLDDKITVFHPGRRIHQLGWFQMILLFVFNTVYFHVFGRVYSKEWKKVR